MDRKILFRGKRKDNGEWVIANSVFASEEFARIDDYEVLRNTVGQWTGLCDIHDCPIFEDDIVVYAFADVPDTERGAVVFEDGEYKLKYFSGYMDDDLDSSMAKRQIVIGNIHDDPEMCEVEQ